MQEGDPTPGHDPDESRTRVRSASPLPDGMQALLCDRLPLLAEGAVAVLPAHLDGEAGRYREQHIYAVKALRRAGVDARYLHAQDQREFLHEHSSGDVAYWIAIGAAGQLSAHVITALWKFIREKASGEEQNSAADAELPVVRIEIQRVRRRGLRLKGVVIEGPTDDETYRVLKQVLGEADDADAP